MDENPLEELKSQLTDAEREDLFAKVIHEYDHSAERAWHDFLLCYGRVDPHEHSGIPASVERRVIEGILSGREA